MPWLTRRSAEWSLMVLAILVLIGVFGRQFRVVQAQGELAAIKSTVGALRTALAIDHLKHAAGPGKQFVGNLQRNPFLVLDHIPSNYVGLLSELGDGSVPPGNWVFDSFCYCVGYQPMYSYALDQSIETEMVWFRVSHPPGPLQITPLQAYRWQGELVN